MYKNAYLFCASAYAYSDYAKTGTFRNKAFKWGYFPERKKYEDVDALIEQKQEKELKIPEIVLPKIGRNDTVVISKNGEQKEMKFKKAEQLIKEEGWMLEKW